LILEQQRTFAHLKVKFVTIFRFLAKRVSIRIKPSRGTGTPQYFLPFLQFPIYLALPFDFALALGS
jgi:hypothetical protein